MLTIHLVQLSGAPALLGAERIAWRMTGGGINVMSGGNASGKSLLSAAIHAASYPAHTVELRRQLHEAGLLSVTIIGQNGERRMEWSLDLDSGAVTRRPQSNEDSPEQSPVENIVGRNDAALCSFPHVIVNGEWRMPEQSHLSWAAKLLVVPFERELASWENRLDHLEHGDSQNRPDMLLTEIERIDGQLAEGRALLAKVEQAEERLAELQGQIGETELAMQIASAEETELVGKVESAERAVHLESWAGELRTSWEDVEGVRNRFAQLQDRLEELQAVTRGLPDNAEEIARSYLQLQVERETVVRKLVESERNLTDLKERERAVRTELSELSATNDGKEQIKVDQLREAVSRIERELTDISRKRIDLLRKRDALERQRHEKYGELAMLGPDEWVALEKFLSSADNGRENPAPMNIERERNEHIRITERMKREFAGFDRLGAETPVRLERLYALREMVGNRENELALLRSKVVEIQSQRSGGGLAFLLTLIGAVASGIPSGLLLGWDVGFFAAVIGGGAGFGIGRAVTPKPVGNAEDFVRKIESLQREQQEALSQREALRLELAPFSEQLNYDNALARWTEYTRLAERKTTLETAIVTMPVISPSDDHVPTVLRKLEREDIRRRVAEFRELSSALSHAASELMTFDQSDSACKRREEAEAEAQLLREEIAELENQARQTSSARAQRIRELDGERVRLQHEMTLIPDVESARKSLREIIARLEELDQATGGALGEIGPDSVLQALQERSELQNELRDVKSKLSTEHSPQELAVRTGLIEDELEQVTERLREVDPLFGTMGSRQEALTKYREQLDRLLHQTTENAQLIDRLRHAIADLNLDELRSQVQSLPAESLLLHNRGMAQQRLDELQRSIHTAHSMCDALSAELAEHREHAPARVKAILQTKVFEAVGERFASVEFVNGEWGVVMEDGTRRPLSAQSRGTRELLMLCLNAGLLSMTVDAERAPVVWDDVLSQLDDHHLSIAWRIIDQVARDRQVILMTRDERIRAWGRPVELVSGHQQLESLMN